mmetsp:Transcript_12554/g.14169  ORF Transcript_12554/g.14169 Transcript_12554/m.14169 type:complete len:129 (+) Transcript_12554:407-793(+)
MTTINQRATFGSNANNNSMGFAFRTAMSSPGQAPVMRHTASPGGSDEVIVLNRNNIRDDNNEMNDIKKKNLEMDLQLKTMEAERMTNNLRTENISRIEALKGEPNCYSKEKALAFFPQLSEIINIVYD